MINNENGITISEKGNEKSSVSARVNKQIYEIYKESEIPISLIIETSLIHFLKLSDEERITFISENLADNVKFEDIKIPKMKWSNLLAEYIKKLNIPDSVSASLLTGVSLGAITVLGGVIGKVGSNIFSNNKKNE